VNLLCDTGNQTGVSGSEVPSLGFYFNTLSHCTGSNETLFLGPVLLLHGCAAGWNYDWNALTTLRNKEISFFRSIVKYYCYIVSCTFKELDVSFVCNVIHLPCPYSMESFIVFIFKHKFTAVKNDFVLLHFFKKSVNSMHYDC